MVGRRPSWKGVPRSEERGQPGHQRPPKPRKATSQGESCLRPCVAPETVLGLFSLHPQERAVSNDKDLGGWRF